MKKRQPASRQPISYRSLNYPAPVTVAEDGEARPLSITLPSASSRTQARRDRSQAQAQTLRINSIEDVWQVDDEWWREKPISRKYYRVVTENDRHFTIFRDQTNGAWYRQQG